MLYIPVAEKIEQEQAELSERQKERAAELSAARRESKEYETIKKNVDMLLADPQEVSSRQRDPELE